MRLGQVATTLMEARRPSRPLLDRPTPTTSLRRLACSRRERGRRPVRVMGAGEVTRATSLACRVARRKAGFALAGRRSSSRIGVVAIAPPALATQRVVLNGVGTSFARLGRSFSLASLMQVRVAIAGTTLGGFALALVQGASLAKARTGKATRSVTRPGPTPRGAVGRPTIGEANGAGQGRTRPCIRGRVGRVFSGARGSPSLTRAVAEGSVALTTS